MVTMATCQSLAPVMVAPNSVGTSDVSIYFHTHGGLRVGDTLIIRLVISIGPIMRFLDSISISKLY